MDYKIEIAAWGLGYDEADELVEAIADLMVERGLGTGGERDTEEVRSVIALKPQGLDRLDASDRPKLKRVMTPFAKGARLIVLPGEPDHFSKKRDAL